MFGFMDFTKCMETLPGTLADRSRGRHLGKETVTDNPKYLPKYSPSSKPESLSNFLAHMFIAKCLIHPPHSMSGVPFLTVP